MRQRVEEHITLFLSVLKWFVLATAVGIIVGSATALFIITLDAALGIGARYPYYYVILPLTMGVVGLAMHKLFPKADAFSTNRVIEYIHSGQHPGPLSALKAFALPIATIASGGSAGREAPAADMGVVLGSIMGRLFRLEPEDRRKLMICGMSAGFAAVFGTPIGGAIFGVEVLYIGSLLYDVLLPSFIAGITSYQVASAMGVSYFYHPIGFVPHFTEFFFIKVIIAGVAVGTCSLVFIELVAATKALSSRINASYLVKGLVAGGILVGLTYLWSGKYLGLGAGTIQEALHGHDINWYDFAVKAIFTAVTISFGGCGGLVTPVLFIGATFGSILGVWLGLDPGTSAAIGLVALLSGACNTPIAASIMSVELFGSELAPYAVTACIVSFLMTGHRSIYPSQVLTVIKSSSFEGETGGRLSRSKPKLKAKRKSLIRTITGAFYRDKSTDL